MYIGIIVGMFTQAEFVSQLKKLDREDQVRQNQLELEKHKTKYGWPYTSFINTELDVVDLIVDYCRVAITNFPVILVNSMFTLYFFVDSTFSSRICIFIFSVPLGRTPMYIG